MIVTAVLLSSGLLIGFYLLICNRLIAVLHPMRMALVDLGEELIAAPGMPRHMVERIDIALDSAYSAWRARLFVVLMPLAAVATIWDTILGRNDKDLEGVPADCVSKLRLFQLMSFVSVLGNSPISAVLVAAQLVVYALLFLPVGKALRELMVVSEMFDGASASLRTHLPHMDGHASA